MGNVNTQKIVEATRMFLQAIGENEKRDGLIGTPMRVARMWEEIFKEEEIKCTVFKQNYDEMIFLGDIPFYSFCEHHLMPFYGKAYIGYIPREKVVGLSKLVRLTRKYSNKLQIQERLTQQIAQEIQKKLNPKGVGVMVRAEHLCMSIRGVKAPGTMTATSCLLGCFKQKGTREEFLSMVEHGME